MSQPAVEPVPGSAPVCVFCRATLGDEPQVACDACGTRLHAECSREVERCTSLGCAGAFRAAEPQAEVPRGRVELTREGLEVADVAATFTPVERPPLRLHLVLALALLVGAPAIYLGFTFTPDLEHELGGWSLGHGAPVLAAAFAPQSNNRLASIDERGEVHAWRLRPQRHAELGKLRPARWSTGAWIGWGRQQQVIAVSGTGLQTFRGRTPGAAFDLRPSLETAGLPPNAPVELVAGAVVDDRLLLAYHHASLSRLYELQARVSGLEWEASATQLDPGHGLNRYPRLTYDDRGRLYLSARGQGTSRREPGTAGFRLVSKASYSHGLAARDVPRTPNDPHRPAGIHWAGHDLARGVDLQQNAGPLVHHGQGGIGYAGEAQIALDPIRRRYAVSSARGLEVWSYEGRRLHDLEGHGGRTHALLISPSGRYLVTCGEDGKIRVWEPE